MRASFPKDFDFPKALRWMLLATRDGRYSGSATTMLDKDAKEIRGNSSFSKAVEDLLSRLSASPSFTPDDFREEYSDKFLRLILYLTVYTSKGRDWIEQGVRIGYDKEDNEINEGFRPEWHHIFPRKIVKDTFDSSLVDSFANIAVLNEKANRAFSAKPPRQYLKEHKVARERLDEQAVPPDEFLDLARFEEFIRRRAEMLAGRATTYLQGLGDGTLT